MIVGDVHGCLDELEALLDVVAFEASDALISVGDLVGKGPRGADTVRFFREGGHRAVRGNHDQKLLEYRSGERAKLKGRHRADAEALSEADWAWLDALPLFLELEEHDVTVVHAGRLPDVPLEDHDPWVLMNLRSVRDDGSPSKRLDDGRPWAELWKGPRHVVFGHDAITGLQRWPHATGLDTGCVYGGALTAYLLPERRVVHQRAFHPYEPVEGAPKP